MRVLTASARRARIAGLLSGAAVMMATSGGLAGCTTTTVGGATVDAADAPAYRTSMSMSSSQSAASSRARESERQASLTTQAMHATCETLSTTSADAIDAVNAYVDAYNTEGGDVEGAEGPAVDALEQSADAVETSVSDVVPAELQEAFAAWVDGARAAAGAIRAKASPDEFNQAIDDLNGARTSALRMCDATYR